MKKCLGCGEIKPLDDFHKTNRTRDGRIARCKPCKAAYNNPEKKREYDLVWRKVNRERRLKGYREYAARNADKIEAWTKSDRGREVGRRSEARRRAIKAGLPQEDYTLDQILLRDGHACWLCGKVPTGRNRTVEHLIAIKTRPEDLEVWGLDHPGDVLANVAIACQACNSSKLNYLLVCAVARYYQNLTREEG